MPPAHGRVTVSVNDIPLLNWLSRFVDNRLPDMMRIGRYSAGGPHVGSSISGCTGCLRVEIWLWDRMSSVSLSCESRRVSAYVISTVSLHPPQANRLARTGAFHAGMHSAVLFGCRQVVFGSAGIVSAPPLPPSSLLRPTLSPSMDTWPGITPPLLQDISDGT